MTGAMYAAIGGLQSHMSRLNVIGNNIANVNTYGYKKARMTFRESMYTTRKAGSDGNTTSGGNNPSQIGYGAVVGSIDLNMNPSTYSPTGYDLDCMIMGEGFFLVGDKVTKINDIDDVQGLTLTRVGDFTVDAKGYLCDRAGMIVYGFATVQNPDYDPTVEDPRKNNPDADATAYLKAKDKTIISTELVPLRLPLMAAEPTAANGGIQNAGTATEKYLWEAGDPVYPVLGAADATTGVQTNKAPNATGVKLSTDGKGGGPNVTRAIPNTEDRCVQLNSMSIGKDGCITGIDDNDNTVVIGYVAVANVDSPSGVTHDTGPYYKALGGAGQVRVACLGGVLEGKYLSNQPVDKANDPSNAIMTGGSNTIENGGLEASSTDIAEEFANMITTQRGYQANTRIVTVTDSMLEELVNMKR